MNKKFLFGITLLGALSFYSCSNETVIDSETGQEVGNNEQVISLTILNSGDGLTSRAGRPLYGTEAKQTIDKVRLWICDSEGNVVYIKDYSNWQSDSESYENGRMANFILDNRLTAGTYTVYAIGYDSNSDYDLTAFTGLTTEPKSKYSPNTIIAKKSGSSMTHGEEFFAGSLPLNLSASDISKGFKKEVVLNRQVAGAYIYVNDIPYNDGKSKFIRLVASAKNDKLVFGNFANIDIASNGGAATAAKFVVNGTNTVEGEYEICKIDLQDWFYSFVDNNNDGLIDATVATDPAGCQYPGAQGNNWKNPYKPTDPNSTDYPTFRRGSVFGGEFIIPFAKVAGEQTLKLQLLDSSKNELLSWNINLSSSDQQVGKTVTYWNNSSWGSFTSKDDKNSYSLVRNHVYGIGNRTMDNPGWNPDPEEPGTDPEPPVDPIDPEDPIKPVDPGTDPDPDPTDPTDPENPNPDTDVDDPESLNNKQYLTVKVNDNWEIIHGMELE